jgi:anti-anti-sigma factor
VLADTTLKITVEEGQNMVIVRLEGRVAGAMVDELNRTWRSLAPSLGGKRLVIDLHDLIFMDSAGVAALADIHNETGAEFRADTPLTKYFAEEAMKTKSTEERKGA